MFLFVSSYLLSPSRFHFTKFANSIEYVQLITWIHFIHSNWRQYAIAASVDRRIESPFRRQPNCYRFSSIYIWKWCQIILTQLCVKEWLFTHKEPNLKCIIWSTILYCPSKFFFYKYMFLFVGELYTLVSQICTHCCQSRELITTA